MHRLAYKIGLRLERIPFVRSAIDEKADLSGFNHKPTFKLVLGIFLIVISNTFCWPTITALTGISIYYRRPWILIVGGPAVYGITFAACSAGMALSGGKYVRLLFRWWMRLVVERMLSHGTALSIEKLPQMKTDEHR